MNSLLKVKTQQCDAGGRVVLSNNRNSDLLDLACSGSAVDTLVHEFADLLVESFPCLGCQFYVCGKRRNCEPGRDIRHLTFRPPKPVPHSGGLKFPVSLTKIIFGVNQIQMVNMGDKVCVT